MFLAANERAFLRLRSRSNANRTPTPRDVRLSQPHRLEDDGRLHTSLSGGPGARYLGADA